MNKYGFYIKKLQVIGENVETAEVKFTKGLNVIYGASDTGKTFIYECIDYMLGASEIPKITIEEARGYKVCKLEIESFEGTTHILKRSFDDEMIEVDTEDKPLKANNKGKKKSISDFLMSICNIGKKRIKTAKGKTRELYFKDLKKLFLVDEVKIINKYSPILSGQRSDSEFDKNLFKFILTGEDDSNIISLLTKEEVVDKKGNILLYNDIITDLKKDCSTDSYDDILKKIDELDIEMNSFEKEYALSQKEFQEHERIKNSLSNKITEHKNNLITIEETLKRGSILNRQYKSDISRLKASVEAGKVFDLLSFSNCPVCNKKIHSSEIINFQDFLTSSDSEITKITLLIKELEASQKIFNDEKIDLLKELALQEEEYKILLVKIENEFNSKLEKIALKIKEFSKKKESLIKIKILQEKLNEYVHKKDKIVKELHDDKEKNKKQNILSTEVMFEIIQIIEDILIDMNFDASSKVEFSDKELDFTFGEKKRKDFGKGYRAVLYAVFIIAILKYLKTKPYQIGFVMIDTPLNPYKLNDKDDGGKLSENLAENFYRYLSQKIKNEQVILIENTPIPNDIVDEVNYIKFTKGKGFLKDAIK